LVGMDSHARVNPWMLLPVGDRRVQLLRPGAGANGQQRIHADRARPLQHRFAVFGKLRKIYVRVRINKVHGSHYRWTGISDCLARLVCKEAQRHYFNLDPISTSSSGNPASTGRPSGPTAAAMIIPFDSTPRNLRGARFTTTATFRPINFSGS